MSPFSSWSQCVMLFALILACGLHNSDAQITFVYPKYRELLQNCCLDTPNCTYAWERGDWTELECKCRGGYFRADDWQRGSKPAGCISVPDNAYDCEPTLRCTRRRRLLEMGFFHFLSGSTATSCIEARNALVNLSTTATAECMSEGNTSKGTCSVAELKQGCANTEEMYAYFKTMSPKGLPGIVLKTPWPYRGAWYNKLNDFFRTWSSDFIDDYNVVDLGNNMIQIYVPGAQLKPTDPYWWMNILFRSASKWTTDFILYPKPDFCNEFNPSRHEQPDYTNVTLFYEVCKVTSSPFFLSRESEKLNQVFCTCLGYPDSITTCPIPYAADLTQAQNCMAAYSRGFLSMMDTYTGLYCNATMRDRILSSYVNYGGHYLCEMHNGLSARNLPESYLPEITRAWKDAWTQVLDPTSLQSCARNVSIATADRIAVELDKKDCQCKGGTYGGTSGCLNHTWSCDRSACNRRRRIAQLEAYSPYLASAGQDCDQARQLLTAAASSGRDQCVKEVSTSCYDASSCDNVTGIYSFFKSLSLNNASGLVLRSRFSTTSNLTDLKRSISVKLNIVPEDLLVWVPRDDGVMQIYAAGYSALDSSKPVSTLPVEEQLVPFSDLLESVLPPKPAFCTTATESSVPSILSRDCASTEDDRNALEKAMETFATISTSFCSCLGLGIIRGFCMVPYGLELTKVQECMSVMARSLSTTTDDFARKHCNATTFQKVNEMTRTVMGRELVCSPYFAGGLSESSMQPLLNAWEAAATTGTNSTTTTAPTSSPKSKSAVGAIVGAVVGVLVLVGLLLFARYMWVKKHSQGEGSYDDEHNGKSKMNKELLDV